MRKVISLILFFVIVNIANVKANIDSSYIVQIDKEVYSVEHFKWWWENWREPNQPLIENLDPYIKWLLFLKEAKKMGLDEDPEFERKKLFFLKPRVILRLQQDEVESKIKITRKELKELYKKEFIPIYQVKMFIFTNYDEAKKYADEIRTIDNCNIFFESYGGLKINTEVRPWNLPTEIKDQLKKVKKPKVLGLLKYGKDWAIICVEKIKRPDTKDFTKLEGRLKDMLKKRKRGELTDVLVEKLKNKYNVVLNNDLLSKINLEEPGPDIRDKILLKIADKELSVDEFYKILKRDLELRNMRVDENNNVNFENFKIFLINSIIAQNLIDIEALNRGYEREEPLRSQYEFYKDNLLVKAFINNVILPNIAVSEEDLRNYYDKYKKDNEIIETVKAIVVETKEEKLIDMINERKRRGKSLESILKELGFKDFIYEQEINKYSEEIRGIINSMREGEIREFSLNGKFYIIKVIRKKVDKGIEYEKLRDHIRDLVLKEKLREEENKTYELLKANYDIKVNIKVWEALKQELRDKGLLHEKER